MMTKPLQLWLPVFSSAGGSPRTRRDLVRACQVWRGESRVWIVPKFGEPLRWPSPNPILAPEVAVSSEVGFNCVDVLHVGRNGFVGSNWQARFRNPDTRGLIDKWLNCNDADGLKLTPTTGSIEAWVPWRIGDSPYFFKTPLEFPVNGVIPFAEPVPTDGSAETAEVRWPPRGEVWDSVHMSEEIIDYYSDLEVEKGPGKDHLTFVKSRVDPKIRAVSMREIWAAPFDHLMPMGGGVDLWYLPLQMAELAGRYAGDRDGLLREASEGSAHLFFDGVSTRLDAWFFPTLNEIGAGETIRKINGALDASFPTLKDALKSEAVLDWLYHEIPVTRCLGILGLFWALFLEVHRRGQSLRRCERCGRVIFGQLSKRFCGKADDLICYRRRRAGNKSGERKRKGLQQGPTSRG